MITIGRSVLVPEPNGGDIHSHSFVGTVVGVFYNGLSTVLDQDEEAFDIETERLQIVD